MIVHENATNPQGSESVPLVPFAQLPLLQGVSANKQGWNTEWGNTCGGDVDKLSGQT